MSSLPGASHSRCPPPPTLTDLQEQEHSVKCLPLTEDLES